jgi:hypothetical protein
VSRSHYAPEPSQVAQFSTTKTQKGPDCNGIGRWDFFTCATEDSKTPLFTYVHFSCAIPAASLDHNINLSAAGDFRYLGASKQCKPLI